MSAKHTLTVELWENRGNLRRVLRPSYGAEQACEGPLTDFGRDYVVDNRAGLDALRHVLSSGTEAALKEHLSGRALMLAGQALFAALVGPEEGPWALVKKALFRHDWAAPTNQAVRVRVLAHSPSLAGLPWGLTAWRGSYLRDFGWTFETTDVPVPALDLRVKLPTGILLILPTLDSNELYAADHRNAMVELLERHFHGFSQGRLFSVAKTRREVERHLKGLQPSIVYFYGHGEGGAQAGLHVPEDDGMAPSLWSAQDVAHALHDSGAPLQVAYLNGCSTGAGGWHSVGRQLLERVPLVLAQPTTTWTEGAGRTALGWLDRVLSGQEPVATAFHRESNQPVEGLGWLPPLVFSRHHSFTVDFAKADFTRPRQGLDLDRHLQREQAHSQVTQLALRPERRLQGFIALGSPRNHPEDMAKQLRTYIEDADPRCLLHMTAPLRVGGALVKGTSKEPTFADDTARQLAVSLEHARETPLAEVLAAKAPPRTGRRHRILWLDWQVLHGPPVKDDVEAWLSFCAGRLVPALPPGVDLVVSLAVEVPATKLSAVKTALDVLVGAYRTDRARFTVLPVLSLPDSGEILQFLEDAGCSSNLQPRLTKLLLSQPNVDYAMLRERMEEGLATTWHELLKRLEPTAGTLADDDGDL